MNLSGLIGPTVIGARLFGLADGYAGTELLNSVDDEQRFVTVDRWRRVTDFLSFQDQFRERYRSLDVQLEGLTESETKLGAFTAADDLSISIERPKSRM
jgi:hypothetical protein